MTETMNVAGKLYEEYEKKLKALQETCPHPETKWMRYMRAPGHISPGEVMVCLRCEKILDRRSPDLSEEHDPRED